MAPQDPSKNAFNSANAGTNYGAIEENANSHQDAAYDRYVSSSYNPFK